MAHEKNVPSLKHDMAKRMKMLGGTNKRPTMVLNLHPRVNEMKGKADRANKPRMEATAQLDKRFSKDSSNGSHGGHSKVEGGWEGTE